MRWGRGDASSVCHHALYLSPFITKPHSQPTAPNPCNLCTQKQRDHPQHVLPQQALLDDPTSEAALKLLRYIPDDEIVEGLKKSWGAGGCSCGWALRGRPMVLWAGRSEMQLPAASQNAPMHHPHG